jgi:hypothetical protein
MMLLPAIAILSSVGLPAPVMSSLLLTQDGRMDKFIAAPRITLPADLIPDHVQVAPQAASAPSSGGVVKPVTWTSVDVSAPQSAKERKISIHVYSEQTSDLISQLQQQSIQLIINLATFPVGGVVIDIDDKPVSFVMTTLGEAMGGAFLNRGGVWVWTKQPVPVPFGGGGFSDGAPVAMELVKTSDLPLKAVAPYREVAKRDVVLTNRLQPRQKEVTVFLTGRELSARDSNVILNSLGGAYGNLKLSASQQKTLQARGFVQYSELSKYQKTQVPQVPKGGWLIINGIKIKG